MLLAEPNASIKILKCMSYSRTVISGIFILMVASVIFEVNLGNLPLNMWKPM